MSRIKTSVFGGLIAFACFGLAPSEARAGAVTNLNLKGASIFGQFSTVQSIACGTGTSRLYTFLSWNAFQGQQRDRGALTNTLNAGVFIQRNNDCTGERTFDFAFVDSGISLTVNGIKSATLSGQFPLAVSGDVLTLNLTLTGTGNTYQGLNQTRTNIGPVLFIQRSTGSSTSANSVSGTASVNGQNIPLVNLSEVAGSIYDNTFGQLLVVGAGA